MSHNSPVIKARRKAISLDTKIKILDQLATGQGATAVGKIFGIHEATIRTIKKNETAIRKSVRSGTKISAKSSSYIRDVVKEKMEKALVMWIEDKLQKRIPVDGMAIKQTALRIYKRLKEVKPGTSSQSKQPEFAASTGWMTGFLKRHALHNIKIKGGTVPADELAAKRIGYNPDQISSVDKSLLFWRKMPRGTYVAKSKRTDKSMRENEIIDLTLESHSDREYSDNDEKDPPILNATLIKEGLDLAQKLCDHFVQHDPDEVRASKFQLELKSLMVSYRELYNDLLRNLNSNTGD